MSPSAVRNSVLILLTKLGVKVSDLGELEETLLYQEGRIYARSYRVGEYLAMWLPDAHLVQVYDPQGNLACAMETASASTDIRRAA